MPQVILCETDSQPVLNQDPGASCLRHERLNTVVIEDEDRGQLVHRRLTSQERHPFKLFAMLWIQRSDTFGP